MNDLYRFVNGPWLESHIIPDDRGVDGTFHNLRDRAEEQVRELVVTDTGRAGTLFRSFMDSDGVEAAGIGVLDEDLELLTARNTKEFVKNLGRLERIGVTAPVTFWVEKDSNSVDAIAYVVQSGLGLPDEAYYREATHADTLAAYERHVGEMLHFLDPARLFGLRPEVAARRIVALETDIAAGHWDVVSSRDAVKTYNPGALSELPEPVRTLLAHAGLSGTVVVMMPSYLDHLAGLLTDDRLADWQLWGTWHILRSRASVLAEEIGQKNFEFYGTRLSGATQLRDRWKRGVALVESFVGQELGKAYVAEHFPESSKKEMLTLVDYLLRAYEHRISALPWMTETTKRRALEKLSLLAPKIGYPDTWRSYEGLEFSPAGSDLVANVRAGAEFLHNYELGKVGAPADRTEWVTTPQTVNAFYNPVVNDITFPAAILQAPFYDPSFDAAELFGAIGAVIGHEIGHAFDDQGSQYDGHGNLNYWWTDEDRDAFTELTDRLVGQFSGLVPQVLVDAGIESPGVNGEFTLGENIGDLGGLGIAVIAYQLWVADHGPDDEAPFEVDGGSEELAGAKFTGMQRLFLAWARVWRTAIRPEMQQQYLAIDPHSPAEFRCNQIAANIDEFYDALPQLADSRFALAPEERVTIW
ncbi:M13 family metallopeptidase [Corynebacterium uterequi]|uniref:Putative metalloendopeptidase n=1 Tax=Corynebacterium uterequi TaxID=1072256 RepID=A0A0G3H9V0_9CORY|nr:M13-type metalloendopeptidase [Corynebacterium uterequi]AKK10111.1 putative metalloendopeptidase [Corynebacterium uterequi]